MIDPDDQGYKDGVVGGQSKRKYYIAGVIGFIIMFLLYFI